MRMCGYIRERSAPRGSARGEGEDRRARGHSRAVDACGGGSSRPRPRRVLCWSRGRAGSAMCPCCEQRLRECRQQSQSHAHAHVHNLSPHYLY
eukprot:scaffold8762_cov114-Isochrysis_galbana.AAC.1